MPRRRRRHRGVRQRADPGPAVQPREAARAHGHRPHRGDPRHLRPERPHARGQGAGRAGAAALPPAPAAPRRRAPSSPSRAAASAPASARGETKLEVDRRRDHAPHRQARGRAARSCGRTRHLQRKQPRAAAGWPRSPSSATPTPASRPCSTGSPTPACWSRTACSPPSTRPPAGWRCPVASRCCSPTPSASCASCPTGWSRRSRARSRWPPTPTSSSTSSTPAPPTRAARSTPCATVLGEIGADRVPELLVFNKADLAPRRGQAPGRTTTRARWRSAPSPGEGIDDLLRTLGDRLRALTTVVELLVPYDRGDVLAAVHREGEVVSTVGRATDGDAGAGPPRPAPSVGRLREFVVDRRRRRGAAVLTRWPARRLRPAALPVRPPRRVAADRRRPARAGSSTCRSARRATRPAGGGRRAVGVGHRARLPAEHRHARAATRDRRLDRTPLRRRRSTPPIVAACVGTKEFVGTAAAVAAAADARPRHVLYPAVAYPTYEMGAILAGCRAGGGAARPSAVASTSTRSTPPTPPGRCCCGSTARQPDRRARRPRRGGGVGPRPRRARCSATSATSSSRGTSAAARSSSTGSTAWWPCTRCRSARTWPASGSASTPATPSWSTTCSEVRKHVGMMVPGPVQAAGVVALDDDDHVERPARPLPPPARARRRGARRRGRASTSPLPAGGFYLWFDAGDGWAFAERLAADGGRAGQPGRVLRAGGARRTCASPWSSPTIASS